MPSEEDDKLINFLVAGGHDGSRERTTSLGNIGKKKERAHPDNNKNIIIFQLSNKCTDLLIEVFSGDLEDARDQNY